jgi:membrane associated rhomboid family serine protease
MIQLTPAVKNILIICVLMFLFKLGMDAQGTDLTLLLGMHYPASPDFKPHQLITYMFMHANIGHLFSNMLGFVFFGRMLEQVWGTKRFINFFLLTGLGALLFHYGYIAYQVSSLKDELVLAGINIDDINSISSLSLRTDFDLINRNWDRILENIPVNQHEIVTSKIQQLFGYYSEPTVGASGAIFGIVGAFAMIFPNTEIFLLFPPIPLKAKWLAIGYAGYEIFGALQNSQSDPIAHLAHLGGMFVGIALVYFVYNRHNRHFY